MARKPSSRKYQITINNPADHGFKHENIRQILSVFSGIEYWCLCDEIGKEGTPHTHVYAVFKNAVMFTTLQNRFYGAHIEPANGNHQENRDYIRKEGKWLHDEKNDTNLIDTFEEYGELPPDRESNKKEKEMILKMVKDGATNYEILVEYPSAMTMLDKIEQVRQTIQAEKHKDEFRILHVTYIWGETGVGKTRSIMEQYGYSNVYRITNYAHPFDTYKGQNVIIFEEFRSSLPISDMLVYLEGYPTVLPCRYADKQACYTQVYIITNIPLERQYPQVQIENTATWKAFLRRINDTICKLPNVAATDADWAEGLSEDADVQ